MLNSYLKQLAQISNRGDAREETYYTALNDLLGEYAKSTGRNTAHVTILPKQTEAGNPDFRVWDGKQHITGYIEAKDPSVENLDRIEDTVQLKRYLHTFPNLILTNFLEFRLYRNGELTDTVSIGRPVILRKLKTAPPLENEAKVLQLFEKFFSFSIPKVYDAKSLAVELAKRTRFLKDEVIAQELREEEKTGKGFIRGFYKAFKDYLISGLTEGEFADLYAQTITYGLFAARTRSEGGFNRKLAYDNIPQTIGILREVFQFVSLGKLPAQMEWIIDDISEVLSVTDINKILHQYFHEGKGKDPIVHFYETFLSEYDPKTRKVRGVYYTPEPVVSYIVRSLHSILKEHFNRPDGFADRNVTVLDPAAGTLTFLAETAKLAVDEFVSKYGEGGKERFIKDHILKNFYAFEWMMAPYAVGHLKMSFLLEELGYGLQKDDRVKLYLTNTLEMEELSQTDLPGMASLSEESHLAGMVKKEQPILVILGNPPYSGHSSNIGEWISKEIRAYYQVDGKPLGEKNPKWLQDDYVKFLRFAQWKIDQAGEGVVGFITSHGYLDNPTFRGMRQSLMTTFDEIRILDLHGNSLKKERCPDGSDDKNVFDIMVGVAIVMFIKKKGMKKTVHHAELWGDRESKYSWLQTNDVNTTDWKGITPKSEGYFFIPRDESVAVLYEKYPKVTDIFPLNSVGIVTARDSLTIRWSKEDVWQTVSNFSRLEPELARQTYDLGEDVKEWKIEYAQKDLKNGGLDKDNITPVLYRPFDIRYTYYTGRSRGFLCRPRAEVMQHMRQENLGLIMPKRVETKIPWSHVLCANNIIEHVTVSSKTIDYLFPLYIYPSTEKKDLLSHAVGTEKTVNISPKIMVALSSAFKKEPSPEEIFHYIYAVLYSNTYRTRYAEFLKTDFPRVPFTKEYKLFKKLSDYGKRLVDLHLLKSSDLDSPVARLQGKGDNKVEKPKHEAKAGYVHINKTQFFEGVSEEVWGYQIGGYQVCDKWLKDRKGRELSLDEIKTYCRIATSIKKTIEIQRAIDEVYEEVEVAVI
mgnify:CR=1 FL=1